MNINMAITKHVRLTLQKYINSAGKTEKSRIIGKQSLSTTLTEAIHRKGSPQQQPAPRKEILNEITVESAAHTNYYDLLKCIYCISNINTLYISSLIRVV